MISHLVSLLTVAPHCWFSYANILLMSIFYACQYSRKGCLKAAMEKLHEFFTWRDRISHLGKQAKESKYWKGDLKLGDIACMQKFIFSLFFLNTISELKIFLSTVFNLGKSDRVNKSRTQQRKQTKTNIQKDSTISRFGSCLFQNQGYWRDTNF